jgi:predicted dehydrogenase
VIQGHKCQLAFEIAGTEGMLSWDFERMNELKVFSPDGSQTHNGSTRIVSGPEHGFHARFNPGAGVSLGYEDLKTIEAHQFLKSIADRRQGSPGLTEALRVAEVLAAIESSRDSEGWQEVVGISAPAEGQTRVSANRNSD